VWWNRQCPNRFAAAYQAGRVLNQLNWHCQLAALISRKEHRQAIGVLVTQLKSVSQEIVQDAPSGVEKQIDRQIDSFWEKLSSYFAVQLWEDLSEELERAGEIPEGYSYLEMTLERACNVLSDVFVEPFVTAIREELKRGLDSSKRWAFGFGEYLDQGMRRADVCAFVNRHELIQLEHEVSCDNGQSEANLDDEEDHWSHGDGELTQKMQKLNDAGTPLTNAGSTKSEGRTPECMADEEQPPFDGYVNCCRANYHPVPGSILPEPAWDQQVLEFARRVGIEKALKNRISPVPLEATSEDVIRVVTQVDECAYAALCRLKEPWYHAADELRPSKFRFGPLKGQKQRLAECCRFPDERNFETFARHGQSIWVRQLGRFEYEVYFVHEARFNDALARFNDASGIANPAANTNEAPSATDSSRE